MLDIFIIKLTKIINNYPNALNPIVDVQELVLGLRETVTGKMKEEKKKFCVRQKKTVGGMKKDIRQIRGW